MKNKALFRKSLKKNGILYLFLLPMIIYILIFNYMPLAGLQIAFKDFVATKGIWGSEWVGFKYFQQFFSSPMFWKLLKNTLVISLYSLVVGFPIPILLALMINSVKGTRFKKLTQTVTYMPHFISTVILVGMMSVFLSPRSGFLNHLIAMLGGPDDLHYMGNAAVFPHLYVWSGIWQNMGWSSIIYLAALAGIDQEQYEAARVDGAGRIRQIISVTLPGLMPTITILFILKMGNILNVGFEKILLLYSPTTYEVADVISTYVYRIGILDANFSYSTAIGLFNSVVNIIFLLLTNAISKKMNNSGLF